MEVNLDYYKLFYNVAKYQSFSKAAEQLFISQSAITQAIQKLEDILGGKLFYRTTRGVVLTEEGKNLYNFIEESINTLMNAQERFEQYKKLEKGKIIIRGPNTPTKFILEKPLLKFLNDYPHIEVELFMGSRAESLKDLNEGKIDMALLTLPTQYEYKNIQTIEIRKLELVFTMTPEFQHKYDVNINTLDALNNYPLILPRKGTKYRAILDNLITVTSDCKYEAMTELIQKDFVDANLGIGFLPKDLILDDLKNGKLIEIKLNSKFEISLGVAVYRNDMQNFATQRLLEYIKNYY